MVGSLITGSAVGAEVAPSLAACRRLGGELSDSRCPARVSVSVPGGGPGGSPEIFFVSSAWTGTCTPGSRRHRPGSRPRLSSVIRPRQIGPGQGRTVRVPARRRALARVRKPCGRKLLGGLAGQTPAQRRTSASEQVRGVLSGASPVRVLLRWDSQPSPDGAS
jgi:hypothetical protein